ncbi:hypothetical protein FO441_05400 [Salinicoccus cyprini]|uniref:Uncharacterized protein n=1 Tax=Salinicoccus cyprini TaxID=2493691 RepID=A0A558AZR7_9STAP|nr:hypothetical protein [Salinicoccus cyprini]TVT29716.1 hypothetical protein FO441_05400 [Salinicoccus cyprini]
MDNGTEEAKAKREAGKHTGMEGRYESRKKSGLVGCLIIVLSLVVLMVILGSCTGIFYGDEQDERITEDQGSIMYEDEAIILQIASDQEAEEYFTLESTKATFKVAFVRFIRS